MTAELDSQITGKIPVINADRAGRIDGFGQWMLDEAGLLRIEGKGDMPDFERGWTIRENSTAPYAHVADKIGTVQIPDGVTRIGSYAFSGCRSLHSIAIPDSVTTIGSCAFENCDSLRSITIPSSVTTIEWGAFWGCDSLRSIAIPNGVTAIGRNAFSGCKGLTCITIPKSVASLGEGAFRNCEKLKRVKMPGKLNRLFFKKYYGISRRCVRFT